MDQKFLDLYEDYSASSMDRRTFIGKLTVLAGGAAAATALLPLLENNYAFAAMVAADDSRLDTGYITYKGASGDVKASMAKPKGDKKLPGVVVVHENRGLNPHIEDVARRVAVEGFLAIAPDALSPMGGTPDDPDKARDMIGQLDAKSNLGNFIAAVKYLESNAMCTGKVGVVGFCWGGAMANQLAVNVPELTASAPYYGRQPDAEDVPKINAALMLHYGGEDERINKGIPAYEEALKKAGKDYQIFIYDGAQHAFNNDTNASRYHKEAAELAWKRTIDFFKEKLKA